MNTSTIQLGFGPLTVSISAPAGLLAELRKDFSEVAPARNTDIEVFFVDDLADVSCSCDSEWLHVGKGVMRFTHEVVEYKADQYFEWQVRNLFSSDTTKIFVRVKKEALQLRLLRMTKQFLSVEFNSKERFYRSVLSTYTFMWFFLSLSLLKKGYAFTHAGIVEKFGKALAVIGTGGCGKTSLTLELLDSHQFNYLSEDFGCVSSVGAVNYVPKTISLYHSDMLHGNALSNSCLGNLNWFSKLKWKLLTKVMLRNPILKVSPTKLTNRIGASAQLGAAFFLIRGKFDAISIKRLSSEEMAQRTFNASFRELSRFHEFELLIKATSPNCKVWPRREWVQEKYEAILVSALNNVPCFLLSIPAGTAPSEVAKVMLSHAG